MLDKDTGTQLLTGAVNKLTDKMKIFGKKDSKEREGEENVEETPKEVKEEKK